jgi:hypothetical protein
MEYVLYALVVLILIIFLLGFLVAAILIANVGCLPGLKKNDEAIPPQPKR